MIKIQIFARRPNKTAPWRLQKLKFHVRGNVDCVEDKTMRLYNKVVRRATPFNSNDFYG